MATSPTWYIVVNTHNRYLLNVKLQFIKINHWSTSLTNEALNLTNFIFRLPLNGDFTEYQVHSAPVARLRVNLDDSRLFSVSDDGSVAVLEIRDKEKKASKVAMEIDFAEEILVARSDMEEKQATINEMKNKYDELTLQHEYQTKLKELNHSEKTKELSEKMNHDIDAWKMKYDSLVQEKNEAEMDYLENVRQLEAKHQNKIQDLDRKYQQKIVDEVER